MIYYKAFCGRVRWVNSRMLWKICCLQFSFLCVWRSMYIYTYIYVYILLCTYRSHCETAPSVLICFSSLNMSSILAVWTLLRPRLELSETQEDWKGKGEQCGQSFCNVFGEGYTDWGKRGRRCRVGKLSITCLRHSGVGHWALSAAVVAGSGSPEVRWECCDVFAHTQFLPRGLAQVPFLYFSPISHRISCSSMQQSGEQLGQVGGRSEENDGYEWEHFESWSKGSLEKGICGLTNNVRVLKENSAFSSYSFLLLLVLSSLSGVPVAFWDSEDPH